ncbi:MAG: hypothetical protein LBT20_04860 [Clostridiales bacterium]|jgi:hypothetical protein|nr:hypothetical protein [Clostridiales bacterium]
MKIIADTELNIKNKASAVSGRMTQVFTFVMGAFLIGIGIWMTTSVIPSLGVIFIVFGVALFVLGWFLPKIMAKTVAKSYARSSVGGMRLRYIFEDTSFSQAIANPDGSSKAVATHSYQSVYRVTESETEISIYPTKAYSVDFKKSDFKDGEAEELTTLLKNLLADKYVDLRIQAKK